MIHIIITSFREPKSTVRAVQAFLKQEIPGKFIITVVDPFPEVKAYLQKHIRDKRVKFFLDPGEGKSYALNLLLEQHAGDPKDIFIFSDGDVYVNENAVKALLKPFEDSKVGCVTGRPVALDGRATKYEYWAQVAFAGIDRTRTRLSKEKKFFECSGYLFAIRSGVLINFPLKTSEDSIIPYLFWKKGYRIVYAHDAWVYVKNPGTWRDWVAQKVRNIKAHENLNILAPDLPRTKSLWNEIKEGALFALKQPGNPEEFFWTLEMYLARLYIYLKAFWELKYQRKYNDGWRGEVETLTTRLD